MVKNSTDNINCEQEYKFNSKRERETREAEGSSWRGLYFFYNYTYIVCIFFIWY